MSKISLFCLNYVSDDPIIRFPSMFNSVEYSCMQVQQAA